MLFGKVSQRDGVWSQYGRAERIARNGVVRDLNGIEPKIEIAAIGRLENAFLR